MITTIPWFDARLTVAYLVEPPVSYQLVNEQIKLARVDLVLTGNQEIADQLPQWAPAVVGEAGDIINNSQNSMTQIARRIIDLVEDCQFSTDYRRELNSSCRAMIVTAATQG